MAELTLRACVGRAGAQHNCEADARADIARAHRREGLPPLSLPHRFAKLSSAERSGHPATRGAATGWYDALLSPSWAQLAS